MLLNFLNICFVFRRLNFLLNITISNERIMHNSDNNHISDKCVAF